MKPSARKALAVLQAADGRWVPGRALAEVAGYRFGGRIGELRDLGYHVESRPSKRSPVYDYRLPVEPVQLTLDVA